MRSTIQATIIIEELQKLQHATNAELWQAVKVRLPSITLPSVHRTTARLIESHQIGGTLNLKGQAIMDMNPEDHSHFICTVCDRIRDVLFDEMFVGSVQKQIGGDIVRNTLTLYGTCRKCIPQ